MSEWPSTYVLISPSSESLCRGTTEYFCPILKVFRIIVQREKFRANAETKDESGVARIKRACSKECGSRRVCVKNKTTQTDECVCAPMMDGDKCGEPQCEGAPSWEYWNYPCRYFALYLPHCRYSQPRYFGCSWNVGSAGYRCWRQLYERKTGWCWAKDRRTKEKRTCWNHMDCAPGTNSDLHPLYSESLMCDEDDDVFIDEYG